MEEELPKTPNEAMEYLTRAKFAADKVIGDARRKLEAEDEDRNCRDYFAGQIASGLFAGNSVALPNTEGHERSPARVAALCYNFADAMMKERAERAKK